MPTLRATSISSFASTVNVTMPSTSLGVRPASSIAALTASQASCSSLRPDSLENSVWPIPTMARLPAQRAAHAPDSVEQAEHRGAGDVVAEAVGALERDLDEVLVVRLGLAGHAAGEAQRIVGKAGTPRRIDRFLTIASGPAQSVRKRTQ